MTSVLLELLTLVLVLDIWRRVFRARSDFACAQGYSAAISFVTSLLVLRVMTFSHAAYETYTRELLPPLGHTLVSGVQLLTIGFLYSWILIALPGTTRTVMHALSVYKERRYLQPPATPMHSQGSPATAPPQRSDA